MICARNTWARGWHVRRAVPSTAERELLTESLSRWSPLHDRSVPRFAAPLDVAAPVRSTHLGAGGPVQRWFLEVEGAFHARAAAGEQTSMWSSCWTTAFPSLPHRWTLLLPSGAPVRRRMAWSSGFTRFHSAPFLAAQLQHDGALRLRPTAERRTGSGAVVQTTGFGRPCVWVGLRTIAKGRRAG